jgi:hypothetical protein
VRSNGQVGGHGKRLSPIELGGVGTDRQPPWLQNGDGLCYYDLQKELVGLAINRAEALQAAKGTQLWRVFPKDPMASFKDLRKGTRGQPQPRCGLGACAGKKVQRPAYQRCG